MSDQSRRHINELSCNCYKSPQPIATVQSVCEPVSTLLDTKSTSEQLFPAKGRHRKAVRVQDNALKVIQHVASANTQQHHKLLYYITLTLLLLLSTTTPLQATESDSIPLTISSQHRIPDTTATVGKLFNFAIPPSAYMGNISSIKVSSLIIGFSITSLSLLGIRTRS